MFGSVQAQAVSITTTIEADNFAINSSICALGTETGCGGAKLFGKRITSTTTTFSIVSEVPDAGAAITGSRIFGHDSAFNDWDDIETFFAEFSLGNVTDVWLTIKTSDFAPGAGILKAFDGANNLLSSMASGSLVLNQEETLYVSSATPIAYVTLTVTDTFLNLDVLKFTRHVVPEPSTLLMISLGLVGAVGLRYRRNYKG